MAEVTKRRTGEFVQKLFEILSKEPEGLQAKTAIERLRSRLTLTPYEAGDYDSGGNRFERILRFATVDLVKAEWMIKEKGRWTITDAGKKALGQYSDTDELYRKACQLYKAWKNSQPTGQEAVASVGPDDDTPEVESKDVSITYEEAEELAWSEIQKHLCTMPPYEFQDLVASLVRGMGYYVTWVSPPGKDGGVDVLAWPDPLGSRAPRIKVQVKRYSSAAINVGDLRSFMALLGDGDVGLFVTTSTFTKDAHDEARTQEKRRITLVDCTRFVELWIEYYDKCRRAPKVCH